MTSRSRQSWAASEAKHSRRTGSEFQVTIVTETIGLLVCTPAGNDDGDGAQENLHVEPQRPVVDVGEVELHPALELQMIAAFQPPGAGQARPHAQTAPLPVLVLRDFF